MKKLATQIFSVFGNKGGAPAAGRQTIALAARKDLLSKIAGCGPVAPGSRPVEGSGGKVH